MSEDNDLRSSASYHKCWEVPPGAIAIARFAGMESRLRAVLDPKRKRGGLSPMGILTALLVMIATIAPLAALRARAQTAIAPAQQPTTKPAAYFGHLFSADGKPVAGAEVSVEGGNASTITAADGAFSLAGVNVEPNKRGPELWARSTDFGVTGMYGFGGVDNRVQFHPLSSIKLKFVGPDRQPVAGLKVLPSTTWWGGMDGDFVRYPPAWSRELARQTDAAGVCTFVLPQESQTVFEINDLRFAKLTYAARARTGAMVIAEPITIELKAGASLSGKLTYGPTGEPAVGIRVAIGASPRSATSASGSSGITNDRGEYHVTRLSAGTYNVKLMPDRPWEWTAMPLNKVQVAEGQNVVGQNLVLVHGGTITGRVYRSDTDEGMKGLNIDARDPISHQTHAFTQTDSAGRYSLRVPPGTERVFILSPPVDGYDGFLEKNAQEISIADGQTIVHDIKVTPLPGKPVTGRVIGLDGKPVKGIRVGAQERMDTKVDPGVSTTDDAGNFRFAAVPAETILRAGYGPGGVAQPVTVNGGESNITLQLLPEIPTTITGSVVDSSGQPVPDARIEIFRGVGPFGVGTLNAAATDAKGRFSIPGFIPSAWHSLSVSAPGYDAAQTPVVLKPGEATLDLGSIRLSKKPS